MRRYGAVRRCAAVSYLHAATSTYFSGCSPIYRVLPAPQAFYKMFGHTPVAEMHSIAQGMGMNYIVFDRFALNTFVCLLSAQMIRYICCFCIS